MCSHRIGAHAGQFIRHAGHIYQCTQYFPQLVENWKLCVVLGPACSTYAVPVTPGCLWQITTCTAADKSGVGGRAKPSGGLAKPAAFLRLGNVFSLLDTWTTHGAGRGGLGIDYDYINLGEDCNVDARTCIGMDAVITGNCSTCIGMDAVITGNCSKFIRGLVQRSLFVGDSITRQMVLPF